jgi:hypothetical protein
MDGQLMKLLGALLFCILTLPAQAQILAPILLAHTAPSYPAVLVDVLVPMNTSTSGTTLTPPILVAGSLGTCITAASPDDCPWLAAASGMTVGAPQAGCANLGPVTVNGGSTYAAASLAYHNLALADTSNFTVSQWYTDYGIETQTNVTVAGCIHLGPTAGTGDTYDLVSLDGETNSFAAILQLKAGTGAAYAFEIENGIAATVSAQIPVTSQGTYWFSLNVDMVGGLATLYIYSTSGSLVGGPVTVVMPTSTAFDAVLIGNNESGTDSGTTYFQNVMIDWTHHADPLFW